MEKVRKILFVGYLATFTVVSAIYFLGKFGYLPIIDVKSYEGEEHFVPGVLSYAWATSLILGPIFLTVNFRIFGRRFSIVLIGLYWTTLVVTFSKLGSFLGSVVQKDFDQPVQYVAFLLFLIIFAIFASRIPESIKVFRTSSNI